MLQSLLEKELQRSYAWYAVFLILGVLYFFEIYRCNIYILIGLLLLSCIILFFNKRRSSIIHFGSIAFLFFIIGNISACYRNYNVNTYIIKDKIESVWIEGNIEKIEDNTKNKRLYLINLRGKIPKELYRIRVTTKSKSVDLVAGTRIRMICTIMPPPSPSIPGGFDMTVFSYFKGIGAIGYTMSKPIIIKRQLNINSWIENLRSEIAIKIADNIKKRNAAIASGLLVGDASEIDDDDYNAMRIAGTAHLIAISGMHIALIAGILFITLRWILVRIESLAKRNNVKKFAAFIAILGSYFYLLLAGSPVSAERAFIMSAIFLTAIIIDEKVDSMKSLSVAVILILILRPEASLSPSLQMSIAACLGLIAGFNSKVYLYFLNRSSDSWIKKCSFYLFGVTFATITAGIATSILIAYHFKQFSLYSVLANILAVPLNDFFIMPCGLIALIVMPFGLEKYPLLLMDYGIDGLLFISHYISKMPNSNFYIPFFSTKILFLMTSGLFLFCICLTRIRYIGLCFIGLGLFGLYQSKPPKLLLSSSGQMFGIVNENSLLISSKLKERFTQKIWQQSSGVDDIKVLPKKGLCNNKRCFYYTGKFSIAIIKDDQYLIDECKENVDLFINMTGNNWKCDNALHNITIENFQNDGAHAIWSINEVLQIKSVNGKDIILRKHK